MSRMVPRSPWTRRSRTGDEGVGAGAGDFRDVVGLDPAVDLEPDILARIIDPRRTSAIFGSTEAMNCCPPKPGSPT